MIITNLTPSNIPAISCVYKLIFEDGSFYIGSAKNLRSRLSSHLSCIKNNVLRSIYPNLTSRIIVSAEIMHQITDPKRLRKIEFAEIRKQKKNPYFLNTIKSIRQREMMNAGLTMLDIYRDRIKTKQNGAKTSPSLVNIIR